jgi:AraC-like DNA-binding protein
MTEALMNQLDWDQHIAQPAWSTVALSADGGIGTSRIGPLVALGETLRGLGFDPAEVLAGTGFDPGYFTDPDLPVQYAAASRLLHHCATVTDCPQLGVLLGERAGAEVMGLPGLLLMSAPDLGAGLRDLVHTMELHDRGALLTLDEDRALAVLGYSIVADVPWVDHLNDLAMTIGCNLMRGVFGKGWTPSCVQLPRRPPVDPQPWRQFFRAPVRFGATRCAISFPAHWLTLSLPAANPTLHAYLQKDAERLQSLLGQGLVGEVRHMVRATVMNPPCTAARVAGLLGLHERTLNRRLQADGTNFRQVRDDVLYSIARQMLGATSMRLAEVASALGYAEASAFIHAFSRWSGQTPDQWRRSAQREACVSTAAA